MTQEQDIRRIVGINRVNRLIHKLFLTENQQSMVSYFQKYVVSDETLEPAADYSNGDTVIYKRKSSAVLCN